MTVTKFSGKGRNHIFLIKCTVLLLLAFAPLQAWADMIDIGTLGGTTSYAKDINNSGQIVGYSATSSGETHAFLYENGVMTDIGSEGSNSIATAINNSGQIVGYTGDLMRDERAFLYDNGVMIDLGTFHRDGSMALDINDSGQIVIQTQITSSTNTFTFDSLLYQDGVLTGISNPAYPSRYHAGGINNSGHIIAGPAHSAQMFIHQNGVIKNIEDLGGGYASARDINDSGQVVGISDNASENISASAFLYKNYATTDLGTLGGDSSGGDGINNSGQVVGWSKTTSGTMHAFLYENGVMKDIGTLGGDNSYANAINDFGQIVGSSYTPSGQRHAFLSDGEPNCLTCSQFTECGTSSKDYKCEDNECYECIGRTPFQPCEWPGSGSYWQKMCD